MKIAIGADHGGFELKNHVIKYLQKKKIEFKDFGAFSAESVDYPDIAYPIAQAVAKGDFERGIIVCGTGIGMSMVANKVKGVRAALCHDEYTARMAREHNDANVLCLGGRVLGKRKTFRIVEAFLTTDFGGGRHERRVKKIAEAEK